ncbi:acyl carrier protein [Desulfococcus sp.]|uniref:acyl carrier protein n=1 Tax=Desulfococcus sp. TaxID=2025834 RepID=UPI0035931D7D
MTQDELKEVILAVIREIAPEADLVRLEASAKFRDQFEFSSVDFLNFATRLQDRLGIPIPETDFIQLATLAGCLFYLTPKCIQKEG